MKTPRVLLASGSPRRRELLALIGVLHEVRPSDIDETLLEGERPAPHAERLARGKVDVVAAGSQDAITIGADTIVVIDGDILGKPKDATDAARMLRRLSGSTHTVFTAIAAAFGGRLVSTVVEVEVTVRTLSEHEIERYVATGEPMDKAGAYGIQGYGATIVERIDGDYFAVMGLSLVSLIRLLGDLGIRYEFGALVAGDAADA